MKMFNAKFYSFEGFKVSCLNTINTNFHVLKNTLAQSCTTYGPRAKCVPAEAFNLAPKALYFVSLVCIFDKTLCKCVKSYLLWPSVMLKNIFGPTWDLICAPQQSISSTFYIQFFVRTLFWQLFSSYMYLEKAAETMFVPKIRK